ncbi:hypothetical protein K3152_02300 [Qipengyuania sp. 1NDH17]|uniref:Lipoprotein n=1 Tax=Qipengyuania polymorpha TaxID=2867234 RepID=A0ABS7IUJ5_9SPHN|nr:hypothetical protein [Qipengyuania polymorpha]MBX7457066.1 hypothetical protein [Qipengyuania polymorpha]
MKASHSAIARVLLLTSALLAAGCVPAPDSTPAPSPSPVETAPAPSPTPAPTPVAMAEPEYENWIDAPRTEGEWRYTMTSLGGAASFGSSNDRPVFTLWCDRTKRQVDLIRHGDFTASAPMRILTETTARSFTGEPRPSAPERLFASVAATDPLLDAMALTKGRFAVETPDSPTLYLPAWAEVTRVIEDCR